MKVCVFGTGAIGGFVAASLARAGMHEVSAVARGRQLAAMKDNGLTVQVGSEQWQTPIDCTDNSEDLGPQDIVFITLKAPTIAPAVAQLENLIGPETIVVFVMNGIPWWYYYKHGGPRDADRIAQLDPEGKIWDTIDPRRVLGGVAYCSATVASAAVIQLDYADVRFEFGEPDGSASSRLELVVALMNAANVTSVSSCNIRERIWAKLVLNMATGPCAVLTQLPLRDVVAQDGMRKMIAAMLNEALAISRAAGMSFDLDINAAVAKIAKSAHKPSILQDLEAHRKMEVDALYAIPLAIGQALNVDTPMIELLTALVKLRGQADRLAHLYTPERAPSGY